MCLGIPGKIVSLCQQEAPFTKAEVEFDGVRRICHVACVPDAVVGDYVIVHAGIAISRIDATEAQRVFDELSQLDDDDGWKADSL